MTPERFQELTVRYSDERGGKELLAEIAALLERCRGLEEQIEKYENASCRIVCGFKEGRYIKVTDCQRSAKEKRIAELTAVVESLHLQIEDMRHPLAAAKDAEIERLRTAIRSVPEAFDEDTGEAFCIFCSGEMANQTVSHKPNCIWKEAEAALISPTPAGSNPEGA